MDINLPFYEKKSKSTNIGNDSTLYDKFKPQIKNYLY